MQCASNLLVLLLCARMASTTLPLLTPVDAFLVAATVLAPSPLFAARIVGSALVWTM